VNSTRRLREKEEKADKKSSVVGLICDKTAVASFSLYIYISSEKNDTFQSRAGQREREKKQREK
jgi:hypothetical protein